MGGGSDSVSQFNDNTTYVYAYHDGTQQTYVPLIVETECPADITAFPFDEQHCVVEFSTWTNDASRVVLVSSLGFTTKLYEKSSAWTLLSGEVNNKSTYYACCDIPYTSVELKIKMKRVSMLYSFVLLFPITVSWIPIMLGFIAPTACEERISFSISVLLTLVFFIEVANQSLPQSSNHIPMFGKYYIGVVAVIVLSMFITAVVTRMFHSREYELEKDFNPLQRLILRLGSKLPYIGARCHHVLELKKNFRDGWGSPSIVPQSHTGGSTVERVLNKIDKLMSQDEGFEEGGVENPMFVKQQDIRKRTTVMNSNVFNNGGEGTTAHLHVTDYNKKISKLRTISDLLKRICWLVKKKEVKQKEMTKQTCYANAIVDLVDRTALLTETCFLMVWFCLTVILTATDPNNNRV